MTYSNSIFIASADNLLGVWMVREFMKHISTKGEEIKEVYVGVYCSRGRRAHELFTLGANVIEITPRNESKIQEIAKGAKGVVVIPPLESRPSWYQDMEKCLQCLEKASPSVAVMISPLAVEKVNDIKSHEYSDVLKKFLHVEERFTQIGKGKKWSVVRNTLPQEFMLHYSRLIQETGMLMLPTGHGKCAYVSLTDLSHGVCNIIKNPPSSFHKFSFTGGEALDGQTLVQRLNQNVESHISFQDVKTEFAERYLRTEFSENSIQLVYMYLCYFELIKENKLDYTSHDVKKVIGSEPKKIDALFKDFAQLFKP